MAGDGRTGGLWIIPCLFDRLPPSYAGTYPPNNPFNVLNLFTLFARILCELIYFLQ